MLIAKSYEGKKLFLCGRELQKSIKDSSHRLIAGQIERLGIEHNFDITEASIKNKLTRAEFIFKGLRHNADEIKSTEGIDIAWVEEAQRTSAKSGRLMELTVRNSGSEIWYGYNPDSDDDYVHKKFALNPPDNAIVRELNYTDNPWFSAEMEAERQYDLKTQSQSDYNHIWLGAVNSNLEGSYYGARIAELRSKGYITSIPYLPEFPVYTFWDVGFSDYTSIWFAQRVGFEVRLIDFYQNNFEEPDHYAKVLQSKGYYYATHYLPHDAKHVRMGMGKRSISEQLESFIKTPIEHVVRTQDEVSDIMACRQFLLRCRFDEENTQEGLKSLMNFRRRWDENKGKYADKPYDDWAAHAADAFRYMVATWSDRHDMAEEHDYDNLHEPRKVEVVHDFEPSDYY